MPRQQEIPGTERKRNPKLSDAGEEYKKVRDAAIRAGNRATEAKQKLLELCEKHLGSFTDMGDGEFIYRDPEAQIELKYTKRENVKLRTMKEGEDDGVPDVEAS